MVFQKNFFYVIGLVGLIVLPTAASLSYYAVTKDPRFRPLGITDQSLRSFDSGRKDGVQIIAHVEWAAGTAGDITEHQLTDALVQSFKGKGVDVVVIFTPGAGQTLITYRVGSSYMGPYPTSRAAEGIGAAVEAYRMYVPFDEGY